MRRSNDGITAVDLCRSFLLGRGGCRIRGMADALSPAALLDAEHVPTVIQLLDDTLANQIAGR
jgi:hypothetical protein